MQRFEYRHIIAEFAQVARAGQARGAAADDGDLFAVVRQGLGRLHAVRHRVVRHKALQSVRCRPASPLMPRTHFSSHWVSCGQTLPQTAGSALVERMTSLASMNLPCNHQLDEFRNAHVDGAALHAGLILAVEAARRFVDGHRLVVALRHLFKVAVADVRILLARGQLRQSHIRHGQFPPRLVCNLNVWSGCRPCIRGSPPLPCDTSCRGRSPRPSPPETRRNRARPRRQTSSRRRR